MNWWMVQTDEMEQVGLGDKDFTYCVSRKGNLIELTVVELEEGSIVWYGVWNRKEKYFERRVDDE